MSRAIERNALARPMGSKLRALGSCALKRCLELDEVTCRQARSRAPVIPRPCREAHDPGDRSADLRHVLAAARNIGQHMTGYKLIIDMCT